MVFQKQSSTYSQDYFDDHDDDDDDDNKLFVFFADWHHAVFVFPSFPVGVSRDWLCLREDRTDLRNLSRHRALPYNVKP